MIPLAWLREFAPTDLPAEELAERMTHRGVKVEGVLEPWAGLEGVIAVRVLEVRDHPDSDTLCVARIHDGGEEIELVVGVRNMAPGDIVPWAQTGRARARPRRAARVEDDPRRRLPRDALRIR